MVMMNQPVDIIELLFGDGDFLTLHGEVNPPIAEVSEQRLEVSDTRLEIAAQPLGPGEALGEQRLDEEQRLDGEQLLHSHDHLIALMPDMHTLLESPSDCPMAVAEVTIEMVSESPASNGSMMAGPSLQQQAEHDPMLQVSPPSAPAQYSDVEEVSFIAQLQDPDCTVPASPFSPPRSPFNPTGSPFSPPASPCSLTTTPLTTTAAHTAYGPIRRSVKEDLKARIKTKRLQEGKGDLKVEFTPPEQEKLTEEELARRIDKREKNKMAAQKCRERKRQKADTLEAEVRVLEERQRRHELDVQALLEERDHLHDIISVHAAVCPRLPLPPPHTTLCPAR